MVDFRNVRAKGAPDVIDCFVPEGSLDRVIGSIWQTDAGVYWFEPKTRYMSQDEVKAISFKLHALNSPLYFNK